MAIRRRIRHYLLWKRHRLRLEELRLSHPLRYLFLEVTRRCNLACAYCGSECTGRELEGELPTSEWIEIMRQIAADFEAKEVMIAVTGGEPLLKEGILDLFCELTRLGFRFGMVTNGQLLDEEMAKGLVASGIGSISLSMDAPPEQNDELRGRGVSAGVQTAVKNLQDAGFTGKLEIISTVCKPVIENLEEMRKVVAGMKVPLWRAAPVMPIGRAAERPELVPDDMDVRAMLEWIMAARKDDMIPQPEFSEEGFLGYRFEGLVRPYLAQCRAGITVGGIRFDGRISACPELSDAFDQGHIRRDRFKDIWATKYQNMRDRRWARKGICKDCEHWDVCRGGALHLYADTESPILRCFYKMCTETDGKPVPCIGCAPQAKFYS